VGSSIYDVPGYANTDNATNLKALLDRSPKPFRQGKDLRSSGCASVNIARNIYDRRSFEQKPETWLDVSKLIFDNQ